MYRVVIVDDEKTISEGIASLFPWKSIGFEAVSYTDPRVALADIERNGCEVVLSDIEMPGMSGIELCRKLQGRDIIVVFLSSLLKDKLGCGFTELLTRIRMEKAAKMLGDVQYKAYDIAYYVGYDNPKSFSRAFKNYYGCSPMEYRQRGGKES